MKKLSNDENITNLKKRKRLRQISIVFAFMTIIFAMVNLFDRSKGWALIAALLCVIVSHFTISFREKIPINKAEDYVPISEPKKKKKSNSKKK